MTPLLSQTNTRFQQQEQETREQLKTERAKKLSRTWNEQLKYTYGGWTQLSYYAIDDEPPFTGAGSNDRYLREIDNRWWLDLEYNDTHRIFWREQFRHRNFSSGDETVGSEDPTDFEVDQLFYQMDVDRFLDDTFGQNFEGELELRAGRQPLKVGNGVTYDRVHDGLKIALSTPLIDAKMFYARSNHDEFDVDLSRPNFQETTRLFWGTQVSVNTFSRFEPYAYYLTQRDHNTEEPATATDFDYNSNYLGLGFQSEPIANLSVNAEYIHSSGTSMSGVPQTREAIRSNAFILRTEYFLNEPWIPRFQFDYMYGSGDTDRTSPTNTIGGNAPGTTDQSFVGFGYINTGRVLNPDLSNIHVFRAGANVQPFQSPYDKYSESFKNFQLGIDLFHFQKDHPQGGISDVNATQSHHDIGWEADLYANWRVFSDTIIQGRYGYFKPGDAYANDDPRDYLGLHMTFVY